MANEYTINIENNLGRSFELRDSKGRLLGMVHIPQCGQEHAIKINGNIIVSPFVRKNLGEKKTY